MNKGFSNSKILAHKSTCLIHCVIVHDNLGILSAPECATYDIRKASLSQVKNFLPILWLWWCDG